MVSRLPTNVLTFQGLVLATHPSGEKDLVLHVLAHPGGTLSLLQKGGRTPKKGRPRIEPFDAGTFTAREYPNGLIVFKEFNPDHSYPGMRSQLSRLTVAALLLETIQRLIPPGEYRSREVLDITQQCLAQIAEAPDARISLRSLHKGIFRLLSILGYIDAELPPPTSRNGLLQLIRVVEEQISRELLTKTEVVRLCESVDR